MPSANVIVGDCRQVLQLFPDDHFDAVVTDPPYHLTNRTVDVKGCEACGRTLGGSDGKPDVCPRCGGALSYQRSQQGKGFMGKAWDGGDIAFQAATWTEIFRTAKPGAYLLAFGGSRTSHRMACAIEDAGWVIRDTIMWLYGSGFPKSLDLGAGRGTALKPAHEPILLARKPIEGTNAANIATYGTGALNIDACRVQTQDSLNGGAYSGGNKRKEDASCYAPGVHAGTFVQPDGRWPANVIHDGSDAVLAAFPDAPGQIAAASTNNTQRAGQNVYGAMARGNAAQRGTRPGGFGDVGADSGSSAPNGPLYDDKGSAARFFYCAKASKADRNSGCEDLAKRVGGMVPAPRANNHPTVKPEALMRYLVRLVTPGGGMVLDPFAGSGSTGKAATLEGFDSTLIEMDAEYAAIAQARAG